MKNTRGGVRCSRLVRPTLQWRLSPTQGTSSHLSSACICITKRKIHVSQPPSIWENFGAPKGHWKKKENIMAAIDRAEQVLGLQKVIQFDLTLILAKNQCIFVNLQPEDWYNISKSDLNEVSLFPSSLKRIQLVELLAEKYPQHKWDKMLILRGRFTQQRKLERAVNALFPV